MKLRNAPFTSPNVIPSAVSATDRMAAADKILRCPRVLGHNCGHIRSGGLELRRR